MAIQNQQDIREPFSTLWKGKDVFSCVQNLQGKVFRSVKNRNTLRFEVEGQGYFIKYHGPSSWREILKNAFQLKKPVISAENEYRAILKLESLGIRTMNIRAFAVKGSTPAGLHSFLITDEITGHISLEDFCRDWAKNPPDSALKHRIITALAKTSSKMHFAGLNHRDCYLCHFLLDQEEFSKGKIVLCVLDLHRAEIRSRVPRHMLIKDLAGIFFSSMDLGLNRKDALRFIAVYQRGGILSPCIWRAVVKAAEKLYRKEFGKEPPAVQ